MSYLAKKKRSLAVRCFLRCQEAAMYVLIFMLLVLLFGLGLSIYYGEIPDPERLLKVLNSKLEEEGLKIHYDAISIDFTGDILIKNGRIDFTATNEPALEADQLFVDLNYPAFALGKTPFNNIRITGGRLYSPAIVSASGTNDNLIDQVNLSVSRRWSHWSIEFLTAKFQNLDIAVNGDLSGLVHHLNFDKKKEKNPINLFSQYLRLSRLLSDQTKNLRSLEAPRLHIGLHSPTSDTFALDAELVAESVVREGFPLIKGVHASGSFQILPEVRTLAPFQLRASTVTETDLNAQVEDIHLTAWTDSTIESIDSVFPVNLRLTTGAINVYDTLFEHSLFDGQILTLDSAQGRLVTSVLEGALEATVEGNWKQQTAKGSLTGGINFTQIFDRPEFDKLWKLRWSKQHRPAYIDIDFDYPGSLQEMKAQYRVETRDIDIIKTPFEWARVRGTLEGTYADVYQLEGGGYGNDLLCTFRQDLTDPFYRFTMAGRFRPQDINPWWRDWWKNTFEYLEIKGELPWLDMAIRNTFTQKKQLTLFGFAEAENVGLKGMHFDKASVKMFIRPNYIDALELQLERPEGVASGQFQRQLELGKLKNVILDINTSLDLEASMSLFGKAGLQIIEPYTWSGNPNLQITGEFNFEHNSNWQDLHFDIKTDQPMTVYDFPLDSLQVSGQYNRGDVLLEDIEFGFAGGIGAGDMSFLKQEDQSYFLFDLDIEDAELEETLSRIGRLKVVKSDDEVPSKNPKKESEPLRGKLKVHTSGISPAGYGLDRVMAKGNIEVTEGNLAQIPLFGPLSSLMPLTTLRLNSANAFFAWDNGKMTFPNLVMTGNSARLEGVGDFYTGSSNLDFQVRVFLLLETDIPLISNIIMPLFDPFSQMAAVNLKGSLTKPEWRFAMSPFNLFDPKVKEPRPKTKEELLDFKFIE